MKKLSIALLFACVTTFGKAQYVPQGMNYQAVARNLSGEVIANQAVSLKIDLYSGPKENTETYYSETHSVSTNQLGLFTLIIGAGKATTGTFAKVPWSTEEVWVSISIKNKDQAQYSIISSSKLLAVPYAFHAGTAAELVNKNGEASRATTAPVDLGVWKTSGNTGESTGDRLGSTDSTDLVLITNDTERMKITADGNIRLGKLANPEDSSVRQVLVNASGELFSAPVTNNDLNNVVASPLDKVIASGNTTTGNIVFKNDENFIVTQPSNYDEQLGRGKFSMAVKEFPAVNGEGNRSNVVGSFWGYNTNPGGGQAIPGEAAYRFAGETFFDVGGKKMMEFHLPEMHTNSGMGLRPFSMYIDRETGIGSADFQMHQFNFKKVNDAAIDWMRMRNDAGNIRIEMQPEEGGSSYFEMNGRVHQYNGAFINNKSYMVNDGNGLSFSTDYGAFNFNRSLEVQGNVNLRGMYANNTNADANGIAHSFLGNSRNSRLFTIGDETYSEKFYITPTSVMSRLNFLSEGELVVGGGIKPAYNGSMDIKFNAAANNSSVNFISEAGWVLAGQVNSKGIYAKTIQTEKPNKSESAGVLKVGNVVSATIEAVTSKYLKIEIDGVSYKIALVED